MSAQNTLTQLSIDANAVVDFILDNNPSGVQAKMDSIQLLPPDQPNPTRQDLKAAVMDLVTLGTQKGLETFQYVLGVDYDSENTNYTGNLRKELEEGIRYEGGGEAAGRAPVWVAVVDGIFEVTSSVFGWLQSNNDVEITGNIADAAESDFRRNTLFGIPKEIVLAMVAVIGVVAIVAIAKPRRK